MVPKQAVPLRTIYYLLVTNVKTLKSVTVVALEIMAFFDCVICPDTKRYLSEDYMFCQWGRKAGVKIWMCPWMKLSHMGSYIFTGSLHDLAQVGASATADVSQIQAR